jgi:outer membrane protein OmpA-like peptidoglycan-associated protein
LAEEEAARKAAEAQRLAEEERARKAAAEAQRLAEEEAARKAAAERAAIIQVAKSEVQSPTDEYALSQTALTPAQKAELDKKIALLQQYPDFEVFIYGHTCEIGGDAINEKIGLQRAENAKAYIIAQGIDAKRIIGTASKRDTQPIVPNTSEENRRKNRRVEIVVQ